MEPQQTWTLMQQLVNGWGPGVLILIGLGYGLLKGGKGGYALVQQWIAAREERHKQISGLVDKYGERFLASQESQAVALHDLADTVKRGEDSQRDVTMALQTLALKQEETKEAIRALPCRTPECPQVVREVKD